MCCSYDTLHHNWGLSPSTTCTLRWKYSHVYSALQSEFWCWYYLLSKYVSTAMLTHWYIPTFLRVGNNLTRYIHKFCSLVVPVIRATCSSVIRATIYSCHCRFHMKLFCFTHYLLMQPCTIPPRTWILTTFPRSHNPNKADRIWLHNVMLSY